ncbi:hypothetical protein TNCV_787201 [Trichonephila clavipes]|nr:hypothetical protein TNCV_787201 [Trichonephila clavipes]
MITASPLSPDEYAMRIATQTESALICKEYSSPINCFSNSSVPGTTENAFSDGRALKLHRTGRRANRPPPCSLLATVKRDIGRPVACVVCLAISPLSAACFFWPFEIVSEVVKRCCEQFELCSHTCHIAAFLQLPNDSTSGKSIQMSSNRLIIRHFSLRQQLGVILTAIRRAISLPETLILHRQHALYNSDTPPLRLPAYLRMCYRTSPYLIS